MSSSYLMHKRSLEAPHLLVRLSEGLPYTGEWPRHELALVPLEDVKTKRSTTTTVGPLTIFERTLAPIIWRLNSHRPLYGLMNLRDQFRLTSQSSVVNLAKTFVKLDGLKLIFPFVLASKSQEATEEAKLAYVILTRLTYLDKSVAEVILTHYSLILEAAFLHLTSDQLHAKAAGLIEMIMLWRPQKTTFDLCSVPRLSSRVLRSASNGTRAKLTDLCRVFAITISDLDDYEHRNSLYHQNVQKKRVKSDLVPIRETNQELILSVDGLLERLIDLVCGGSYEPRFPNTTLEIDHWMRFIDDQISDEMASDWPLSSETVTQALTERVEGMYVLSLLMSGKHRKRVQVDLSRLGLVPKLSQLFDNFVWKGCGGSGVASSTWSLPGHHQNCECSPEVCVKMQFLRLVHSFCDYNEDRHLMLTPNELEELKRIREEETDAAAAVGGDDHEDCDLLLQKKKPRLDPEQTLSLVGNKDLMCKGTHGLLTKIVDVLKGELPTSTFRFWLCRALEAYLRGPISYRDQVFLLRRGLLQHVTVGLLNTNGDQKEIVQSSFDLLGEMVKFNLAACQALDVLLNTETKLKKAMHLVHEHLVDSNMFVRAMVLATAHFLEDSDSDSDKVSGQKEAGEAAKFASNSRLMAFFRQFDKQAAFVHKLISLLRVVSLTQENVSCLNTSLVIIMLCKQNNKLDQLLKVLNKNNKNNSLGQPRGMSTLENLKGLLKFWQEHYLNKDKDCSKLEKTSRIPFDYWKQTVQELLEEDNPSSCAIVNYINRDQN